MAGIRLSLDVFGDQQLDRELLRYQQRGEDLSPAFEAVADFFLDVERRQFDTQGGYASGGWAPLAESTIRNKMRLNLDLRILHATLRLRESLTNRFDADHIRDIRADEMFVGTGVDYAAYHQGDRTFLSRTPRRRPVEFRAADRSQMVKIVQRHIETGETANPLSGLLGAL